MQVTFSLSQLRAVLLSAAKSDIRYYLNGVYVESNGGTTRMVSTNGHHLLAVDYKHGDRLDWCGNFIIPRDVCEMICKGKYSMSWGTIEITPNLQPDNGMVRVSGIIRVQNTEIIFRASEGVFHNYTRVISPWVGNDTDMKPGHYNPEYIATFSKIAKVFGSKNGYFTLWQRGEDSALVSFGSLPDNIEATGVLMGLKTHTVCLTIPLTEQFRAKLSVEAAGIAQTKDVEPVAQLDDEQVGE